METTLSPNQAVRTAYINSFAEAGITTLVWSKRVPKDVKPIPSKYILLTSQEKNRTEVSKNCWEWLISTTIDITLVGPQGYADTDQLDELEAQVITAIETNFHVPGFTLKSVDLVTSTDLDGETDTQTVQRRILIYQHWLCQE